MGCLLVSSGYRRPHQVPGDEARIKAIQKKLTKEPILPMGISILVVPMLLIISEVAYCKV
jgi:hypothetical protein